MHRRAPRRRSTSCCAPTENGDIPHLVVTITWTARRPDSQIRLLQLNEECPHFHAPTRRRAHCETRARTASRGWLLSGDLPVCTPGGAARWARSPRRAHDYLLPASGWGREPLAPRHF